MSAILIMLRSLARSPGYAVAAILTLALGIGASTAMFSLMHGSLLRPLPYDAPEQLLHVRDHYLPTGGTGGIRTANFFDMQRELQGGELAAYEATSFNIAAGDRPERAAGLRVTANFLQVLGARPSQGRGFVAGEDRAGREDVVVVSHHVWQERFAGRSDIIGQSLLIDARPHTVVGVLAPAFWYPSDPQLIVPFAFTPEQADTRGNRWLDGLVRMHPAVTPAQAGIELNTIFAGIRERFPGGNEDWAVRTTPLAEHALGTNRSSLLLVNGAVLLLLLIGTVNVANLMLVRAERRSREMAMRVALGASRGRIAGQYIGEALLLAVFGAAGGVLVAALAIDGLVALYGSALPRASQVSLSMPVLLFAAGVSVAAGLLAGLVPALRTRTGDVYDTLRQSGRGGAARSGRVQQALVAGEVALAVMLVTGAALLVHSFARLHAVDSGIDPDNALVFTVQLPEAVYDTRDATGRFYQDAVSRIAALPGVRAAGVSELTPLQGGMNITQVESPLDPDVAASFVELRSITPDFFAAAGIPLLQGRGITDADVQDQRPVVVISDELARGLFADAEPIGQRLLQEWNGGFEIVGVVGSVREFGVTNDKRPAMYVPLQLYGRASSMVFMVRTAGDPMAIVPGVRAIIGELDPAVPIYAVRRMQDVITETTGTRWLATNLFATFGVLALILAAFGMFAVLAYVVEQRTRDIGIRMALGATRSRVHLMVMGQGLRVAAAGLVVGLLGSMYGSALIADLLWEVEPTDVPTLAAAAAVALVTAAAAALLPAMRATRVEPAIALTQE